MSQIELFFLIALLPVAWLLVIYSGSYDVSALVTRNPMDQTQYSSHRPQQCLESPFVVVKRFGWILNLADAAACWNVQL